MAGVRTSSAFVPESFSSGLTEDEDAIDVDFLYSCSLLISLLAGVAGVLTGILAILGAGPAWLVRTRLPAIAVAGLSLAISVVVHKRWGHGPGSAEPMGVADFAGSHSAFYAASIVIVAGLVLFLYARRG